MGFGSGGRIYTIEDEAQQAKTRTVNGESTVFDSLKARNDDTDTQLAENEQYDKKNQTDFLSMFQAHKNKSKILYRLIQDRRFDVFIPQYGEFGAMYRFFKNTNDDFIRMGFVDYSQMPTIIGHSDNKNYESTTGTWSTASPPNYYTSAVGGTFSLEFYGTGIDFLHYADTRGGIWEFSIDGEIVNTISTHLDAVPADELFNNYGIRPVVRDLQLKTHTLVATFKGDDPANPPSSSPSRGWVRFATPELAQDYNYTTHVYGPVYQENKVENILHSGSVKEFAIAIDDGTGVIEWMPEHSSKGSTRAVSQEVLIDGVAVSDYTEMKNFKEADAIIIKQNLIGFHPNAPSVDVCEIVITHTITPSGVSLFGKIKWLKQTRVTDGYAMMMTALPNVAEKLFSSNGAKVDVIKTDNTFTEIPNGKKAFSFMVTDSSDYVSILNISNVNQSLRNVEDEQVKIQVQHRTDMQKLYPTIYKGHTVNAGDEYRFSCHYEVGKLANAQNLFV